MQENDNNTCHAQFLLLHALFAGDGRAFAAKNNFYLKELLRHFLRYVVCKFNRVHDGQYPLAPGRRALSCIALRCFATKTTLTYIPHTYIHTIKVIVPSHA